MWKIKSNYFSSKCNQVSLTKIKLINQQTGTAYYTIYYTSGGVSKQIDGSIGGKRILDDRYDILLTIIITRFLILNKKEALRLLKYCLSIQAWFRWA